MILYSQFIDWFRWSTKVSSVAALRSVGLFLPVEQGLLIFVVDDLIYAGRVSDFL